MDDSYRSVVESLRQMNKSLQGVSQTLVHIMEHNIWKQIGQVTVALDEYSKSLTTMAHEFQKTCEDWSALGQMCASIAEISRVEGECASKIDRSWFTRLGELAIAYNTYKNEEWETLKKALELFQSTALTRQMEEILPRLEEIDSGVLEAVEGFDIGSVSVSESTVTFDGVEYTQEQLAQEVNAQMEEVSKGKVSLREKCEQLQKRFRILFTVLKMLMCLPAVVDTVELCNNVIVAIQETISERSRICFTIKERSILREEPSSKARRILTLPYDTPLEIVEIIPRWYQVKYTNEAGEETVAWISKISVETEE